MDARYVIVHGGRDTCASIENRVDAFEARSRAQAEFRQVCISGDDAMGQYASFSIWNSQRDA